MTTPTGEVRAHLDTVLTPLGVNVYPNPVGTLTPPCVALVYRGSTPTAGWAVTEEAFDVEVSVPLAGQPVPGLDELVWETVHALTAAGVLVDRVDGYDPRPDTSTLTCSIPTRTIWKDRTHAH